MLTLDSILRIPTGVLFTTVEQDAVLLNTHTNTYYALTEVGARLWGLLTEGKDLRAGVQILLNEFEVDSNELEGDLLKLLNDMLENGLVEIVEV